MNDSAVNLLKQAKIETSVVADCETHEKIFKKKQCEGVLHIFGVN
jgi:hypothetical protein